LKSAAASFNAKEKNCAGLKTGDENPLRRLFTAKEDLRGPETLRRFRAAR